MVKKMLLFLFCFLTSAALCPSLHAQSCPKWGPYAGAKGPAGNAELMMADVMTPQEGLTPYTYSCAVQFGLGKSGGYCGLQDATGSDSTRPFNNIFSVWDYPNKVQIQCTYKAPMTYVGGFGHEGTGLHSHCDFGWKPGRWYTNVVRRWYAGGDKTYVGYFIYDHTLQTWTHYVTFAVPETDAMLHGGISSFLENFADDAKRSRTAYYKSYWRLTPEGQWQKPDSLQANAGAGNWSNAPYGDDGLSLTSCGKEMINGVAHTYPVRSKETTPAILSVGEVYDLGAYYDKGSKKVFVDWSIKASKAPQLSYTISVYDKTGGAGNLLGSASGFGPEVRNVELPVSGLSVEERDYYVVLKIKDIFGQEGTAKEFTLEGLKP